MKGKIALAIGLGVLVAGMPVAAAPAVYASWDECMAVATADDPFDHWEPTCVQNANGTWKITWTNMKRKTR